ncbi:MAG: malonyl-CoA decarboxylase [Rhodospirillales bacterium]
MNNQAQKTPDTRERADKRESAGFLDRTLRNLKNAWRNIAGSAYDASAASARPDLPDEDLKALREQMRDCLETRGGEVSARARAAALGHVYLALDAAGRKRFLRTLAEDFDVSREAVDAAVDGFRRAGDDEARHRAEAALRDALEAPRIRLLTQFNALPDGVKFLVDMRAELLALRPDDPASKGLEQDLKRLLTTWFDVDFLELRRITWDNASASLLEKLIAYEAVHAIDGWDDLKNRLDSDRRCFAYFHPRMPDEPLIFVEVALVNGLADNIQALLDERAPVEDPQNADTAIFYSISNAQRGLAGISFGNFLIKRVADQLAAEFKGLKTFATLSPVPGFSKWLDRVLAEGEPNLLSNAERKALSAAAGRSKGAKGVLKALLSDPGWGDDESKSEAIRGPLMRLCARYAVEEKGQAGRALDPVTHFHLSNGARVERLNWWADPSAKGFRQSAGMMINYIYDLSRVEENHEAYTSTGKITASSAIRSLLKR